MNFVICNKVLISQNPSEKKYIYYEKYLIQNELYGRINKNVII